MQEEIKSNIFNPDVLEQLYRDDRKAFRSAFFSIYPEIENTGAAVFWKARLDFESRAELKKTFSLHELIILGVICIIVAFLIKIPAIFSYWHPLEIFYLKNAAIIVFAGLAMHSIQANKIIAIPRIIFSAVLFLIPTIYINLLPADQTGNALYLVHIHLPFLMWFIFGIIFNGFDPWNLQKRIDFIRFNGDLAIMFVLIAIAGGILTGITIGLFASIGLNIGEFYGENIVLVGAAAAPVVASFLIYKFPSLITRIAPLIATIFSPLVLLTLVIFLITMAVTGKDLYNDRDFLLIFNIMLLGVMVIIIFTVSETSVVKIPRFNAIVLFSLTVITIIIDLLALSAIFYRLGEHGITPNRLAVLVPNLLVLVNLGFILTDLFRINFKKKEFKIVEMTVARFIPVYLVWIIIVIFFFPFIFGFR